MKAKGNGHPTEFPAAPEQSRKWKIVDIYYASPDVKIASADTQNTLNCNEIYILLSFRKIEQW